MDEGYIATRDGIRLHFRSIGQGAETVVIPAKCFLEADLGPLADGFRLVLYDPRGRGGSDPVTLDQVSIDHEISDLEAVRDHLALEQFSLIGWSYLSLVAALYASHYPAYVKRLVMIGVFPMKTITDPEIERQQTETYKGRFDPAAMQRIKRLREEGVSESDPEQFAREHLRVTGAINTVDPTIFDRMQSQPFRYPNEHPDTVTAQIGKLLDLGEWDFTAQARNVQCPTLLINGSEELTPMRGAEDWSCSLPDARLLRIDGAAHWPWLETPDSFFPVLREFLGGAWPQAAAPCR